VDPWDNHNVPKTGDPKALNQLGGLVVDASLPSVKSPEDLWIGLCVEIQAACKTHVCVFADLSGFDPPVFNTLLCPCPWDKNNVPKAGDSKPLNQPGLVGDHVQ